MNNQTVSTLISVLEVVAAAGGNVDKQLAAVKPAAKEILSGEFRSSISKASARWVASDLTGTSKKRLARQDFLSLFGKVRVTRRKDRNNKKGGGGSWKTWKTSRTLAPSPTAEVVEILDLSVEVSVHKEGNEVATYPVNEAAAQLQVALRAQHEAWAARAAADSTRTRGERRFCGYTTPKAGWMPPVYQKAKTEVPVVGVPRGVVTAAPYIRTDADVAAAEHRARRAAHKAERRSLNAAAFTLDAVLSLTARRTGAAAKTAGGLGISPTTVAVLDTILAMVVPALAAVNLTFTRARHVRKSMDTNLTLARIARKKRQHRNRVVRRGNLKPQANHAAKIAAKQQRRAERRAELARLAALRKPVLKAGRYTVVATTARPITLAEKATVKRMGNTRFQLYTGVEAPITASGKWATARAEEKLSPAIAYRRAMANGEYNRGADGQSAVRHLGWIPAEPNKVALTRIAEIPNSSESEEEFCPIPQEFLALAAQRLAAAKVEYKEELGLEMNLHRSASVAPARPAVENRHRVAAAAWKEAKGNTDRLAAYCEGYRRRMNSTAKDSSTIDELAEAFIYGVEGLDWRTVVSDEAYAKIADNRAQGVAYAETAAAFGSLVCTIVYKLLRKGAVQNTENSKRRIGIDKEQMKDHIQKAAELWQKVLDNKRVKLEATRLKKVTEAYNALGYNAKPESVEDYVARAYAHGLFDWKTLLTEEEVRAVFDAASTNMPLGDLVSTVGNKSVLKTKVALMLIHDGVLGLQPHQEIPMKVTPAKSTKSAKSKSLPLEIARPAAYSKRHEEMGLVHAFTFKRVDAPALNIKTDPFFVCLSRVNLDRLCNNNYHLGISTPAGDKGVDYYLGLAYDEPSDKGSDIPSANLLGFDYRDEDRAGWTASPAGAQGVRLRCETYTYKNALSVSYRDAAWTNVKAACFNRYISHCLRFGSLVEGVDDITVKADKWAGVGVMAQRVRTAIRQTLVDGVDTHRDALHKHGNDIVVHHALKELMANDGGIVDPRNGEKTGDCYILYIARVAEYVNELRKDEYGEYTRGQYRVVGDHVEAYFVPTDKVEGLIDVAARSYDNNFFTFIEKCEQDAARTGKVPTNTKAVAKPTENKVVGINISSYEKGLGKELGNFASLPVVFRGVKYPQAEAAYQACKGKDGLTDEHVLGVMIEVLTAKLTQHPSLTEQVTQRGGKEFLTVCTHNLVRNGQVIKQDRWTGKDGLFMQALRIAYANVVDGNGVTPDVPPAPPAAEPTTASGRSRVTAEQAPVVAEMLKESFADELAALYEAQTNPLLGSRSERPFSAKYIIDAFCGLDVSESMQLYKLLIPNASGEVTDKIRSGKKYTTAQTAANAVWAYLYGHLSNGGSQVVDSRHLPMYDYDFRLDDVRDIVAIVQGVFDAANAKTIASRRLKARPISEIFDLRVVNGVDTLVIDGHSAFVFDKDGTVYDWRGRAFGNVLLLQQTVDAISPNGQKKVDVYARSSMGSFVNFLWLVVTPILSTWNGRGGLLSNTFDNVKIALQGLPQLFPMSVDRVQDQNGAAQFALVNTYAPQLLEPYTPVQATAHNATWQDLGGRCGKKIVEYYRGAELDDSEEGWFSEDVSNVEPSIDSMLERAQHAAHQRFGIDFHYAKGQFVTGMVGHINIDQVKKYAPRLFARLCAYLGTEFAAYMVIANTIKAEKGLKRVSLIYAQAAKLLEESLAAWHVYGMSKPCMGWKVSTAYFPTAVCAPGTAAFIGAQSEKPVAPVRKVYGLDRDTFEVVDGCPFDFTLTTLPGVVEAEWTSTVNANGWTVLTPTQPIYVTGTKQEIICGIHGSEVLKHHYAVQGELVELRWRVDVAINNVSEALKVEYAVIRTECDPKLRQVNKDQMFTAVEEILFNGLNPHLNIDQIETRLIHFQDGMKMDTLYAWLFIVANTVYYNYGSTHPAFARLEALLRRANVITVGHENLVDGKVVLVIEPTSVAAGVYEPILKLWEETFATTAWIYWPQACTMAKVVYELYKNRVGKGWYAVSNALQVLPELKTLESKGQLVVMAQQDVIGSTTNVLAFILDDDGNAIEYAQRSRGFVSVPGFDIYNVELFESSTVKDGVGSSMQLMAYIKALSVVTGDCPEVRQEQQAMLQDGREAILRAKYLAAGQNGGTIHPNMKVATIGVDEADGTLLFIDEPTTNEAVDLLIANLRAANVDVDNVDRTRDDLFSVFAHAAKDIVFRFEDADGPVSLWLPALYNFTKLTVKSDEHRDYVSAFFYTVLIPCVENRPYGSTLQLNRVGGTLRSFATSRRATQFMTGRRCVTAKRIGLPNIPVGEIWILISNDTNSVYQECIRGGIPVNNFDRVRKGLVVSNNRAPMPMGPITRIRLVEEVWEVIDGVEVYKGQRLVAFEGETLDGGLVAYEISPVHIGLDVMSVNLDGGDYDGDPHFITPLRYLGLKHITTFERIRELRSAAIGVDMFSAECGSYAADHYGIKTYEAATLTLNNTRAAVAKATKPGAEYVNYNIEASNIQTKAVGVMYGVYMMGEMLLSLVYDFMQEGLSSQISDAYDFLKDIKDIGALVLTIAEIYEIMLGGYSKNAFALWSRYLEPVMKGKPFIDKELRQRIASTAAADKVKLDEAYEHEYLVKDLAQILKAMGANYQRAEEVLFLINELRDYFSLSKNEKNCEKNVSLFNAIALSSFELGRGKFDGFVKAYRGLSKPGHYTGYVLARDYVNKLMDAGHSNLCQRNLTLCSLLDVTELLNEEITSHYPQNIVWHEDDVQFFLDGLREPKQAESIIHFGDVDNGYVPEATEKEIEVANEPEQTEEWTDITSEDGLHWHIEYAQAEGIYDELYAATVATYEAGIKKQFGAKKHTWTCAGDYFWVWSKGRGQYLTTQPDGSAIIPMPAVIADTAEKVVAELGLFDGYKAQTCLINRYESTQALNNHIDKDEQIDAPIVSFSFGALGIFNFDGQQYQLGDGDLFVFYGNKRYAVHGYGGNLDGQGVRYNVTVRMVKANNEEALEETEAEETQEADSTARETNAEESQMKYNVVISGSRSIASLPVEAMDIIDEFIDQGASFNVGDAPGVDVLVQKYLHAQGVEDVRVWYSADRGLRTCLNGFAKKPVKGNYTARDAAMHRNCDESLVVWDGKSPGSKKNIDRVENTRVVYPEPPAPPVDPEIVKSDEVVLKTLDELLALPMPEDVRAALKLAYDKLVDNTNTETSISDASLDVKAKEDVPENPQENEPPYSAPGDDEEDFVDSGILCAPGDDEDEEDLPLLVAGNLLTAAPVATVSTPTAPVEAPSLKKVLPSVEQPRAKDAVAKKVLPNVQQVREETERKELEDKQALLALHAELKVQRMEAIKTAISQKYPRVDWKTCEEMLETLSAPQLRVPAELLYGKNIALTGVGGGGKSYTVQIVRELAQHLGIPHVYVGSTGTSVMNIEGDGTLNAVFGLRIGFSASDTKKSKKQDESPRISQYEDFCNLVTLCRGSRFVQSARMRRAKHPILVVVDEVSMVDNRLLHVIQKAITDEKIDVQWLLVGDPMQFVPCSGDLFFEPMELRDRNNQAAVKEADFLSRLDFVKINLSQNLRADGDQEWVDALNMLRLDQVEFESNNAPIFRRRFDYCVENGLPEDAVHLFFNNAGVKMFNKRGTQKMINAGAQHKTYKATITNSGTQWHLKRQHDGYNMESVTIYDPIEMEMTFCLGMPVMIRKNTYDRMGNLLAANGSMGVVTELGGNFIQVELDGNNRSVRIEAIDLPAPLDSRGRPKGVFHQIPAHPCFAMTFHKCQGLTLRKNIVVHFYCIKNGKVKPIDRIHANSVYVPPSRVPTSANFHIATSTEFDPNLEPKDMWRLLKQSYHTHERALAWIESIENCQ